MVVLHSVLFIISLFLSSMPLNANAACNCGNSTSGWTIWRGNCYKLFTMPLALTFPSAEKICQSANAHAASVHSENENRFIASMAKEHFELMEIGDNARAGAWRQLYASFWLGYRRVRTPVKGQFHCFNTDGTPMDYANVPHSGTGADGLHNELPGYPWNGPNPGDTWSGQPEDCVQMIGMAPFSDAANYGTWNDMNCEMHTLSGVVCKKPITSSQ